MKLTTIAILAALSAAVSASGCYIAVNATDDEVCITQQNIQFPGSPIVPLPGQSIPPVSQSFPFDGSSFSKLSPSSPYVSTDGTAAYLTRLEITPTSGTTDLSFIRTLDISLVTAPGQTPVDLASYAAPQPETSPVNPLEAQVSSNVNIYTMNNSLTSSSSMTVTLGVGGQNVPLQSWTADVKACFSLTVHVAPKL